MNFTHIMLYLDLIGKLSFIITGAYFFYKGIKHFKVAEELKEGCDPEEYKHEIHRNKELWLLYSILAVVMIIK